MSFESLTLKSIRARPVVLKLNRPVVARIVTLTEWPLILIDLYTEGATIPDGLPEDVPRGLVIFDHRNAYFGKLRRPSGHGLR
jgi:hypothetical protein